MPTLPRRVVPTGPDHRVTTLELFFDLVFVFAFTQVTALVAASPNPAGALRGAIMAALLWWVWCSYSWLGNQARADEGILRQALFLAMAAMMVLALAIPEAWADAPGGLPAPLVLAGCLAVVQGVHLGVYALAADGDRGLLRQIGLVSLPVLAGTVLLVVGALVEPGPRTWCWLGGMLVNYAGIYVAGDSGWRLPAPRHFAERYSLIVLIALGESIVAIGVGVAQLPISLPIVTATLAAMALSVALWWLYFDVLAFALEHRLVGAPDERRTALARDALTYLHFPVVVAVLGTAVGIKKVFGHVGDPGHGAGAGVHGLAVLLLAGGPALYLLALSALRRRCAGGWSRPRLAGAALLAALAGCGAALPAPPALVQLAAVTAVPAGLVLVERRTGVGARSRYREAGPGAD